MKSFKLAYYPLLSILLAGISPTSGAQSNVPAEAASILNLSLVDGQSKLQNDGYEIADSSLFGRTQLWWNEATQACIELKFDKGDAKNISSVESGDKQKCVAGAAASRKVWDSYRDGQAPADAAALNAERSQLSGMGYAVSYWIDDAAPGRDSEFWYNEATNKCMRINWNSADNQNIGTSECKPEQGKNPAPN